MKLAFLASLALVSTLMLAGCEVTQSQLDDARASYDAAFLTPASHYRQLGFCKAGTTWTLAKPCADRAVVASLVATDNQIAAQFNTLQAEVTAGNGTASLNDFTALQSAISAAQQLIATLPTN